MSISVEGQKCPVCTAYMFDNDDIVFCPLCGAPHHRDCYAAVGHCAFEDKHGTPLQYKKPERKEDINQEQASENSSSANSNLRCSRCGSEIPFGQANCPNCSAPVQNTVYTPFGTPITLDPMGGVSPDDMIDDIPAKEVSDFVVVNTPRYLTRFKAMNSKKKKSWNWGAFLFPQAWYFYRKMYLPGILFFLLTVTASLLGLSYLNLVSELPMEAQRSSSTLANYIIANAETLNLVPLYLASAGFVLELVLRVISGFIGDKIYRKTVLDGVRLVKSGETEQDLPLNLALRHKGGVNMIMGVVGLFGVQWITTILFSFI